MLIGFVNGLNLGGEENLGDKNDIEFFSLRNWEYEFVFIWDGDNCGRG